MGRKIELEAKRAQMALSELGQFIKGQRKVMKLSSVEIAFAAGISRTTLHKVEAGEQGVSAGAYAAVLNVLGQQLGPVKSGLSRDQVFEQKNIDGKNVEPVASDLIPIESFPQLLRVSWQLSPSAKLTDAEAWGIYKRNWKYIDLADLKKAEKELIERLRNRFEPRAVV